MSKYSFEEKMEVVEAYLNGEGGYRTLTRRFDLSSKTMVKQWVSVYQQKGPEGLFRSRKHQKYPFEFKLSVVELYLTEEISYQDLANRTDVRNPSTICIWVKAFREKGVDGLKPKPKGRAPKMPRSKESFQAKETSNRHTGLEQTPSGERLQELEKENLHLRIENAYLKELRRVRLEETRATKQPQESFTSSEETSD